MCVCAVQVSSECVVVRRYMVYVYKTIKFTFIQSTNYEPKLKYCTDLQKLHEIRLDKLFTIVTYFSLRLNF